jgi:hypothetical protein
MQEKQADAILAPTRHSVKLLDSRRIAELATDLFLWYSCHRWWLVSSQEACLTLPLGHVPGSCLLAGNMDTTRPLRVQEILL